MGQLLSYSLYSSIMLAILYLAYKWVLASENYHRLNRAVIWSIYAVALLWLPVVAAISALGPVEQPAMTIDLEGALMMEMQIAEESEASGPAFVRWLMSVDWLRVLTIVYAAGMGAVALLTACNYIRLRRIIRYAERAVMPDGTEILLTDQPGLAPFSFCRNIVIPRRDYLEGCAMIVKHERSHIELCHWADLLFAQAVCLLQWFNPAAWLMREELKTIHEYQADRRVISGGADIRDYQLLLIKKAVGARFPSLANSLNHSKLKKRITMMYNQKNSRRRALRPLLLLPAMGAALFVSEIPAVASALTAVGDVELVQGGDSAEPAAATASAPASVGKVSELSSSVQTEAEPQPIRMVEEVAQQNAVAEPAEAKREAKADDESEKVFTVVEKAPQFPGGEAAMMKFIGENIRFPQVKEDVNGRVVVSFVVEKDGSVGRTKIIRSLGPEFDKEAERVVNMMPKWTPGTMEGKPVAVWYTLPVSFRTTGSNSSTSTSTTTISSNTTNGKVNSFTTTTIRSTPSAKSSSTSTSTTTDGDGVSVIKINEDGKQTTVIHKGGKDEYTFKVTGPDGKPQEMEYYVDGERFTGDLKSIATDKIESMRIDKSNSPVVKVYINLKH